ncbi:MAG: ADP-ribosylglycohydrolase family protein [Clostridiales bacterium]|nr:ADP-ribosylglycohydrolase family protein [Clostridiales bacterium]
MDKTLLPENLRTAVSAAESKKDRIRGCLLGGAMGDALGYPVEFMSFESILSQYGSSGITFFVKDPSDGKALFSDDTQMSLFTANGILYARTVSKMIGRDFDPVHYVYLAYLDWLETQRGDRHGERICWLSEIPGLWSLRAPGATCLDALSSGEKGSTEHRINHSKGCGGVMRVAPAALALRDEDERYAAMEGAEIAALTHSHSLGFMPAAFLTHVIQRIVNTEGPVKLLDIVLETQDLIRDLFSQRKHLGAFMDLIDRAVELSKNDDPDSENIPLIGAGWCGDEALAIAVYCALCHENDFSGAIISAVNHSGDSDSTGALTGNIVGAICGYEKIGDQWKEDLELSEVLLEMADDICYGCLMDKDSDYRDEDWIRKYVKEGGK